jgi:monovalent cation/proton antiporter MnhG/PhaG subunit
VTGALHASAAVLALAGALLGLLSGIGVLAMRDAYQKLHFVSAPATVSAFLLAVAIALETRSAAASLKALLVVVLLSAANGVLCHATARAAFVRAHGHWPPLPDELRAASAAHRSEEDRG